MLPDAVKATPLDGVYVRKVTRVQTICDLFNEESSIKALLSEVHKLILIIMLDHTCHYSNSRAKLFRALKLTCGI